MIRKQPCQILALLVFVCIGIISDHCWTLATGVVSIANLPQLSQWKSGSSDNGPEYVTAILGQSVVLNCAVEFPEGSPVPYVVQWEKKGIKIPVFIWYDGFPPHRGEGYENRISLASQASINISDVRESDQGWYECKVMLLNRLPDNNNKNGTWVNLNVHAPPRFIQTPQEIFYVKVGDSLILLCEAEGTPKPDILWYKDTQPLEPSGNVQLYHKGHEVRVTNLRQTDIGEYTCEARNGEGHAAHTSKVIIAGGAVITTPPHNLTKLEGDKAEFICEAKALPGNITYKWYRNDIEINELSWLNARAAKRSDGTLLLHPLSADDTGKYTCEVSNGIGTPQSASAHLDVEYPARVTYTPTLQYLPYGLSGILRCHVEANPPFQFLTWTKDKRVFEPQNVDGVTVLINGSLLFQTVSHDHQGRYTCTPYNLHGTAGSSGVMEVLVREPPKFVIKPKDSYQVPLNKEVQMPCEAQGNPKPDISWRRTDGARLPRGRTQRRGGNITIQYLHKSDYGYYECVVHNEVATLVTSSLLIVESTTPHAPTNVSVNTSAWAATLTWLPAYDGGFTQHYVIWFREVNRGDAQWRTIRVMPEGATTFTIYDLIPESTYDFQVLSRNELGDGMFSPIVQATTARVDPSGISILPTDSTGSTYKPTIVRPSGPKPGVPTNVNATVASNGIQVTWSPPTEGIKPAYYIVEFCIEDNEWKPAGSGFIRITSFLLKDPLGGKTYFFRVTASTTTATGLPSPTIKITVPPHFKNKAITAGVVGGILFFIVAIILSICIVKICNKRKRRRQERAYNMVACRVTDVRNGGHGAAGSPVPLRKFTESRISGVNLSALKRKVTRYTRLALGLQASGRPDQRDKVWQQLDGNQQRNTNTRNVAPMERSRRFPKSVRYQVKMEYSQPAGYISRTADGRFEPEGGDGTRRRAIPSSFGYGFGSGSRSGSGLGFSDELSPMLSPVEFSVHASRERLPEIHTIYSPRDPRFRTSSPGPLARWRAAHIEPDVSSVHQPSSAERSFPTTVSSRLTASSNLFSPSYELPSLRILHEQLPYIKEEDYEPSEHDHGPRASGLTPHPHPHPQFHHLPSTSAEIIYDYPPHARPQPVYPRDPYYYYAPQHQQQQQHYAVASSSSVPWRPEGASSYPSPTSASWRWPRRSQSPSPDSTAPHQVLPWQGFRTLGPTSKSQFHAGTLARITPQELPEYALPPGPRRKTLTSIEDPQQRPLATSSPPRAIDRRVARVPPSPVKLGVARSPSDEESGSDERPVAYTRDRLQQAIGHVRSGALATRAAERPFRAEAPGLDGPGSGLISPTSSVASRGTGAVGIGRGGAEGDTTVTSDEAFQGFADVTTTGHHSHTSVTSASSGRGSSERGSKPASVSHSRGNSLQGELEYSPTSRSSSSGFASRNTSQLQPSPHQISSGSSSRGTISSSLLAPPQQQQQHPAEPVSSVPTPAESSGHSDPLARRPPLHVNVSADENYEFDTVSPALAEYQVGPSSDSRGSGGVGPGSGEQGLSDSELYASFYPMPRRARSYDSVEVQRRIPALKEEFHQFKRRQRDKRRSEGMESEC